MIEQRIITKDGKEVLQQRECINLIEFQYLNIEPVWTDWVNVRD